MKSVAVAEQFQNNDKLSWMHWIIPNAEENRDAMQTAWYAPTGLPDFGKQSDRPELEEQEDEKGMLKTVAYLESLIEACTKKGIPTNRIVLGGFSQGMAMSLLTDMVSEKYSGKLAGIVGLMGYLPLASGQRFRVQELRAKAGLDMTVGEVPMFLARGKKDMLIPKRTWDNTIKKLGELGVNEGAMEIHEYEGLAHGLSGMLLRDMCNWLEKVVPKLED